MSGQPKFYMDLLEDDTYRIYHLVFIPGAYEAGSTVLTDRRGTPLVPPDKTTIELERGHSRISLHWGKRVQTMRIVRYHIEDHTHAGNRGTLPDPHAAPAS